MKAHADQPSIEATRRWVEQVVVALNLCPFAKRELVKERVRFVETPATTQVELLEDLKAELAMLAADPSIETALLIHPHVLTDFVQYNDFLADADALLFELGLEGVFQVASFHPDYQFGGTEPQDAENYTNRSPFPMLHLLREDSLSLAIDHYPGVDDIPQRNIDLMNEMGVAKLRALLAACFSKKHNPQG